MKLEKTKNYMLKSIVALLGLFSLLTMCFPLVSALNIISVNGFDFLAFNKGLIGPGFEGLETGCGICSILLLFFAIMAIVLVVFNFMSANKTKIYDIIVIAVSLFITIIYFIEGFILKSALVKEMSSQYGSTYGAFLKTTCFVPFIICVVLMIAYIVVAEIFNRQIANQKTKKVVETNEAKQDSKNEENLQKEKNKTEVNNEEDKIALVLKYKELLDANIISQEDFDAKKKQILGL